MHDRPHYAHAVKIVDNFRRELGPELSEHIGEYHFGTLVVLIESAINSSVMDTLQAAGQDVEALLKKWRHPVSRM